MSNCRYCGKAAGFLRKKHPGCDAKNQEGVAQANRLIADNIFDADALSSLAEQLTLLGEKHWITAQQMKRILSEHWENAVHKVLDEERLTNEEEETLIQFKNYFSLTQDDVSKRDSFMRMAKTGLLRDMGEGKIPQRMTVENHPFNLQKNETLVWFFVNVGYYEDKKIKQPVARPASLSIRLAKGVYYRKKAFKAPPIVYTKTTLVDRGVLGITSKNMYFSGREKGFKISLDKIVSLVPYENGIRIQKNGTTAKPQIFVTQDGWFTYHLLANLARMG